MLDRIGEMFRVWWARPHWFAELWSALVLMGFSVWAATGPNDLAHLPAFREATRIMSQDEWQAAAGGIGLFQFGALWVDRRWMRGAAAVAASWLHAMILLGAVLSLNSPIDMYVLGMLGINIFALVRAVGNAR